MKTLEIKIAISTMLMNWLSEGSLTEKKIISLSKVISKEHRITEGQANTLINECTLALTKEISKYAY